MYRSAQRHDFGQQGSYSAGYQQYDPTNRSHGILEAELYRLIHSFQYHTEENLYHTQYQ